MSIFRQCATCVFTLLMMSNPVSAQTSSSTQSNTNNSSTSPVSSQQNQSRSESIGVGLYSYKRNTGQGRLGDMTVGTKAISCRSPSLFLNLAILPYSSQYFGSFGDNWKEKEWMPEGRIGFQIPIGKQVASCVQAMKEQAKKTQIITERGIIEQCIKTLNLTQSVNLDTKHLKASFPGLYTNCKPIWNQAVALDQSTDLVMPDAPT